MLTQKFFNEVEKHLDKALSVTGRYWCDGVLGPEWESDYKPEYVVRSQQLILRAWMDEGRTKGNTSTQVLYRLILNLGALSLRTYLHNQELQESVFKELKPDLVTINPTDKVVNVQLP